jgi:hypothetical protein
MYPEAITGQQPQEEMHFNSEKGSQISRQKLSLSRPSGQKRLQLSSPARLHPDNVDMWQ